MRDVGEDDEEIEGEDAPLDVVDEDTLFDDGVVDDIEGEAGVDLLTTCE